MNGTATPEISPLIYSRLGSWALPTALFELELELDLGFELDRGVTLSGLVFSPFPATSGIVACTYNATVRTWQNLGYETRSIPVPRALSGESYSRAVVSQDCRVSSPRPRSPEAQARWELELGDCGFRPLFDPDFTPRSALVSWENFRMRTVRNEARADVAWARC